MTRRRTRWIVTAGLTALLAGGVVAAPAAAQSLAEIARREAARRARTTGSAPVYTNQDLAPAPDGSSAIPAPETEDAAASAPGAVPEPDPAAAATPGEPAGGGPAAFAPRPKRDEQYWRERSARLRERLAGPKADIAALQQRIAALRDEAQAGPAPERLTAIEGELEIAAGDLQRFQAALRDLEFEWSLLESAARQDNVPPAWLQEAPSQSSSF